MSRSGGQYRKGWIRAAFIAAAFGLSSPAVLLGGQSPPSTEPGIEARGLGKAPASESVPVITRRGDPAKAAESAGVVRTFLALGGVLTLAAAAGFVVKAISRNQGGLRFGLGPGGRSPAGILEVLGRYPVGRGTTLILLKLDRRILLLSQSSVGKLGLASGMTTLCEVTDPDDVASILTKTRDADSESMSERFRSILSRFDRSFDAAAEQPLPGARSVHACASGDRAEIWNDRADIPIVDLTLRENLPQDRSAAGSLRSRLALARGISGTGGGA